jgi:Uncharacterised nucleotidyltransferase
MTDARVLVAALRDPASAAAFDDKGWTALITIARSEQLIGTLAYRLEGQRVPPAIAGILRDAKANAGYQRRAALWEADCARRALAAYDGKVVLMKGTAYVAAGLQAGQGRHIGDLDIIVARDDLKEVERLLLTEGGWEWVKDNAYDDAYYRNHMHELPPMIHKERDRMIDVHHTILPMTARPLPDAEAMLRDAITLSSVCPEPVEGREANTVFSSRPSTGSGRTERLYIFTPTDMVIHSAAHLIADGDLTGGLRNLWDMHCLLTEYASAEFWPGLQLRAQHHQLWPAVHRATRLSHKLYGTDIPKEWQSWNRQDRWYVARLMARDEWGRGSRKFIRLIFFVRSHWLRMPPLMLAQHLWVKWRKG